MVSGLWGTGEWAYGHGHGAEARRDACRYRSPLGRNSAVDRIWGRRGAGKEGRLGIRRRLVHVTCWRRMGALTSAGTELALSLLRRAPGHVGEGGGGEEGRRGGEEKGAGGEEGDGDGDSQKGSWNKTASRTG